MTRRVLVCIQDTGVAHVVASRLQKDGVDGVVVEAPARLVDEARIQADAVVVQDRYTTGEAGSSLLRQVRVAKGGAVPAVFLLTNELAAPDRHVLEKQYKVAAFLPIEATPHSIASALARAAGVEESPEDDSEDDDLVLHEDEVNNAFDISVDTGADLDLADLGALSAGPSSSTSSSDFDEELATLEVGKLDLDAVSAGLEKQFGRRQAQGSEPADDGDVTSTEVMARDDLSALLNPVHTDPTSEGGDVEDDRPDATREVPLDLGGLTLDGGDYDQPSELPAPGGDADFEFPRTEAQMPAPVAAADPLEPDEAEPGRAFVAVPAAVLPIEPEPEPDASDDDEVLNLEAMQEDSASEVERGEDMQMTDLKKALYAQKKARESAEKRVKELEARVAKLEPQPMLGGDGGVPAEGVFEDLRYPQLLSLCRGEGFTGAIKLQVGGTNTRTVFLRDGLPIGYASSEPGERIGRMMVEQKRITDDQYIKAATVMVERGIKLTEALVELGFIEGETLAVEMRNLTRDQIIHGFELTQGRFTTGEGQLPESSVSTFDFGPGEIYVQGYRQYAPKLEMQAIFESLRDKYLTANTRLSAFRPKLGLGGDDERLLRLLGEAYTLEEAVERAEVTPDHAARLIAALQALDLVEEWSPGVEQFRSRLRTERQMHAEQIASLREEMSQREQRLFEGFERALGKIGSAVGDSKVSLQDNLPKDSVAVGPSPSAGSSSSVSPSNSANSASSSSSSGGGSSSAASSSKPAAAKSEPAAAKPAATGSPFSLGAAANGAGASATISNDKTEPEKPKNRFGIVPTGNTPGDQKYREGLEQAQSSRLDEAEVTLREAVRMDASKPEYLLSLARVLLANPRYERAGTLPVVRSLLDRAVQIAPDHGDVKDLHKQVVSEMGG